MQERRRRINSISVMSLQMAIHRQSVKTRLLTERVNISKQRAGARQKYGGFPRWTTLPLTLKRVKGFV
jgi:hypothetical protein